jgi:hypothetical protein
MELFARDAKAHSFSAHVPRAFRKPRPDAWLVVGYDYVIAAASTKMPLIKIRHLSRGEVIAITKGRYFVSL